MSRRRRAHQRSAADTNSSTVSPALAMRVRSVPRDLGMVGNGQCGDVTRLRHYDVTAALTGDTPTQALKCPDDLARAQQRNRRHQTATSTWRVEIVNGMPFSALTSRHAWMASRMLRSASSSVLP